MIEKYQRPHANGGQGPYPMILGGDFNEGSYLDWTSRAVQRGLVPVEVRFPATLRLEVDGGLTDVFRMMYQYEVDVPGFTWPDRVVDYAYRRDRIDFFFVNDLWLKYHPLEEVFVVGNTPSDHAALVGGFR